MKIERAYLSRNVGKKEKPIWKRWFAYTVADAVLMSEDDGETKNIVDFIVEYVNGKLDELIDGASGTYDTLKKIEDSIRVHHDVIESRIDEETKRAIEAEKNNFDAIAAEVERAKEQEAQKAPVDSPAFIGTVTAPTPPSRANNTQIATTEFVKIIVNELVNGAPETLDTLGEIAEAFAENETVIAALNEAIGKKLNKTETAAAAAKWETGRIINGIIVDGTSNRANYGTCSTPAATVAKTVSCTGFVLVTGAEITVRFTVTNTAANPTLNVSGTGAKPIYYRDTAIPAGYLAAKRTYIFRYNGEQYDLVGDIDTNTKYSLATASTRGLVKIGYEENGKNYPVQLENEQMYVNVPWTDTKYSDMTGATASAAGKHGLAPAPAAGKQNAFLRSDGTWVTPSTSLAGNVPGIPADQTAVKALKEQLDSQNSNLSDLTNKVSGLNTKVPLSLKSICSCGVSGGTITTTAPSGGGVVFNNILNCKSITFTCNAPCQAGISNENGSLPTLCTTGANRASYQNLSAGTHTINMNGIYGFLFLSSSGANVKFSNIYATLQ